MKVTIDINSFDELFNQSWQGGKETLATVKEHGLSDDLMKYLEMIFPDGTTDENLNDYLWFNRNEIYTTLGIEFDL